MSGTVSAIVAERDGAQEISVRVAGEKRRALNLTALNGFVSPGERVLLNTSAVELGLGTGGLDFVVAIWGETEAGELKTETPPGHLMKLRYTPHQHPVLAIESPESPHHDVLKSFTSLDGVPIVCAELHSQLPAILVAAKWAFERTNLGREPRLTYIMTDSASLSLSFSRLVPELKSRGLLTHTITAGQAFGGDTEAINLYSALAAAKTVLRSDVVVVGQGPGNAGTGTELGFSGIAQGEAINAAASLGGVPVAVARISFADSRLRHSGLSHHTRTALTRVARAAAWLPLPLMPMPESEILLRETEPLMFAGARDGERHLPIFLRTEKVIERLEALEATGMRITTMGRTLAEEHPFFAAAAAAGILAARIAEARGFRET